MFRRLLLEDSATLFTIVAFVTAFTIFVTIAWRAVRMKPTQVDRFARLPFEIPTPPSSAGFQPASVQSRLEAGATSILSRHDADAA